MNPTPPLHGAPGQVRPYAPIHIEAGLRLLESQAAILLAACGEAARARHSTSHTKDEAVHFVAVSAPLWLAHEMLQGLVLCGRQRLAAPAHAITRPVWEACLNSSVHLFRGPAQSMEMLKLESSRLSAANQSGNWKLLPDELMKTKQKLEFLRATPGAEEVASKLERSHHYLHKEASARIHGSFYGSLSNATLAGTTLDGEWTRDHEIEPMLMWLMIVIDATIASFCGRFLRASDKPGLSRSLVDQLMELFPTDGGTSPTQSVA